MKKIIALLCSLLCILSLTACSESADDAAKKAEAASLDAAKIEQIQQGTFLSILYLIDGATEDDTYYWLSTYNNEEIENLFPLESYPYEVDGHGFATALESFRLSKDAVGDIVEVGEVTAEIKGRQIIATADVKGSKKDAQVEMIFSNDIFIRLEGGSLNPKASFSELMQKAALNTLIGMGTVFAVLILISIIIACFGFIPKIQAAFAKKEEAPEAPAAPVVAPVAPEPVVEEEDDTELVAVIAAAIAAYEGSTNTEGFVVRSIRRRF